MQDVRGRGQKREQPASPDPVGEGVPDEEVLKRSSRHEEFGKQEKVSETPHAPGFPPTSPDAASQSLRSLGGAGHAQDSVLGKLSCYPPHSLNALIWPHGFKSQL